MAKMTAPRRTAAINAAFSHLVRAQDEVRAARTSLTGVRGASNLLQLSDEIHKEIGRLNILASELGVPIEPAPQRKD